MRSVGTRGGRGYDDADVVYECQRDERLTSPLLPGFSLSLGELFPED
jgi:hypothetical protein